MTGDFDVVISCDRKKQKKNLSIIFAYRDLIRLLVRRDFVSKYKQTLLGPIWVIMERLFTSIVQAFIFGSLAGLSTDGTPLLIFYLSGNIIWEYFSKSTSLVSNTFITNGGLLSKVYFPRIIMPLSETISTFLNGLISFCLLACFLLYYCLTGAAVSLSWYILLFPILLAQSSILGLGVGLCISSLTTKYHDLAKATGLALQLWMYVSPVVYPLTTASGKFRILLLINPMTAIIENFRYCLMGSGSFLVWNWFYSMVITALILWIGFALFEKTEKNFVDTI